MNLILKINLHVFYKKFSIKNKFLNITDEDYWPGTKICQKKYLKSPQWLRNLKIKKKPFLENF